jgi:hypothetical protein
VVLVADRRILGKSYARSTKTKGPRPRSRTLTAVHEAVLEVRFCLSFFGLGQEIDLDWVGID